jgi:hypothetical protein
MKPAVHGFSWYDTAPSTISYWEEQHFQQVGSKEYKRGWCETDFICQRATRMNWVANSGNRKGAHVNASRHLIEKIVG